MKTFKHADSMERSLRCFFAALLSSVKIFAEEKNIEGCIANCKPGMEKYIRLADTWSNIMDEPKERDNFFALVTDAMGMKVLCFTFI